MTAVNAELLASTIELKKRLTGFVGACAEMTDCGEDVEAIKRAEAAICKARTALETGAVGTSAASEQNPITARDGGERERPSLEEVARVIDPDAWEHVDACHEAMKTAEEVDLQSLRAVVDKRLRESGSIAVAERIDALYALRPAGGEK